MRQRLWHNGMVRRLFLALVIVGGALGCSGPYAGKPSPLVRPVKKKRPQAAAATFDDQCKTDFFADASRVKPRTRDADQLVVQGNRILTSGDDETATMLDALGKFRSALAADPYQAEATFKMAVVYAQLRKKGCAVALLKRLAELERHPDFERQATLMIQAAQGESSFDAFRDEANAAVGR